jgi:redox-sensitive bicupin YhaK (pirin superfamily)
MTDPIDLIIPAREGAVGGFTVRRTLPNAKRRMVGPFTFFDHMGPADVAPGQDFDVRPHPHIGLATVTYLFAGEVVHRDSLGSLQKIKPGDINWMTAGRGIVHSERADPARRAEGGRLHGLQLWVALPTDHEETDPGFDHYPESVLPQIHQDGADLTVLAGQIAGAISPVKTLSELFYGHCVLSPGGRLELPPDLGERAAYVVEGAIDIGGRTVNPGEMAVLTDGVPATVTASAAARIMVLGGAPLDGPRHVCWNFVSSSKDRIGEAKADWAAGRFAPIPDDDDVMPLPS